MADNDEDDYFDAPYEPPPSHTSRMSTQRRRTSVFSNLNSSNGLPSAAMPPSLTGRRGSVAPGISGGRRTSRAGLVSTPPEIFGSRNSAKARAKAFWEILRQHVVRVALRPFVKLSYLRPF